MQSQNMHMQKPPIVFIHGLFQNPASWAEWIAFFKEAGYDCHAPAYPFHEGDPESLRNTPPKGLETLDFQQVLDHLAAYLRDLPEKPILIGHSMGGLLVQKLTEMGLASKTVAISSAPPKGVNTFKWSFLKANFPTINPLKGNSACLPSKKWFHYAFCNVDSQEQSDQYYDEYVVPEARNIPRASTKVKIDFAKPHVPLLFIAGANDHIIPSVLNEKNYGKYADAAGEKSLKIFPGRSHFICGQKGWKEIAGYVREWLD